LHGTWDRDEANMAECIVACKHAPHSALAGYMTGDRHQLSEDRQTRKWPIWERISARKKDDSLPAPNCHPPIAMQACFAALPDVPPNVSRRVTHKCGKPRWNPGIGMAFTTAPRDSRAEADAIADAHRENEVQW
jgi:hypothetical protein